MMTRLRLLSLILPAILITPVAQALEDPTRPPDFRVAPPAAREVREYSLDSIVVGPDRRVAVIDGVARTEGERFSGKTLVRIYPDRVTLKEQGRTRILRWKMPPSVRVSP